MATKPFFNSYFQTSQYAKELETAKGRLETIVNSLESGGFHSSINQNSLRLARDGRFEAHIHTPLGHSKAGSTLATTLTHVTQHGAWGWWSLDYLQEFLNDRQHSTIFVEGMWERGYLPRGDGKPGWKKRPDSTPKGYDCQMRYFLPCTFVKEKYNFNRTNPLMGASQDGISYQLNAMIDGRIRAAREMFRTVPGSTEQLFVFDHDQPGYRLVGENILSSERPEDYGTHVFDPSYLRVTATPDKGNPIILYWPKVVDTIDTLYTMYDELLERTAAPVPAR